MSVISSGAEPPLILSNLKLFVMFKIVYVAPMKALAAEMARNFGERLKPLGIQVRELTGDMQLTKTEITQTQVGPTLRFRASGDSSEVVETFLELESM